MMDKNEEGLLAVGTLLYNGRYKVVRHLASGGFGKTYEAVDTTFGTRVAIKELFLKNVCVRHDDSAHITVYTEDNKRAFAAQQNKFRKEAKRLHEMSHPNIIHVSDLFDENGTSYYVMDFVDGESLGSVTKRMVKPFTEAAAMRVLEQLLDALEYVHAAGIWHLDIKPGNIMQDGHGRVLLIDFGASKQLHNSDGDSMSTSSVLAYTMGYAPSEQMEQNLDKFGAWTDLYALGATLYHLLTLRRPASPSDIAEDARKALPFPEGVSERMRQLIIWLMKLNRLERPQSVAEIRQFMKEAAATDTPKPSEQNSGVVVQPKEEDKVDEEETRIKPKPTDVKVSRETAKKRTGGKRMLYLIIAVSVLVMLAVVVLLLSGGKQKGEVVANDGKQKIQTEQMEEVAVNGKAPASNAGSVSDYAVDMKALWQREDVSWKNFCISEWHGLYTYKYTGELNDEGLPMGRGKAVFTDSGDVYEGNFTDGICDDSNCTYTFKNGDRFQGEIRNNMFVQGTYAFADGASYHVRYENGKQVE